VSINFNSFERADQTPRRGFGKIKSARLCVFRGSDAGAPAQRYAVYRSRVKSVRPNAVTSDARQFRRRRAKRFSGRAERRRVFDGRFHSKTVDYGFALARVDDLPDFSVSSVTSCATTCAHCMTASVKRMSGAFLSGNSVVRISLALGNTRPNEVNLGLLSPKNTNAHTHTMFTISGGFA